MTDWFRLVNEAEIPSPALILYPERIHENIQRMLQLAGSADRLRPHIKTHKLAEIVRMHLERGIRKFKCATIAEAEMAAASGSEDVLLAYPVVGPNADRLLQLVKKFPQTKFSAVADDAGAIRSLSKTFAESGQSVEVLLDIDCGQHRTGVEPGPKVIELYRLLGSVPGVRPGGLHVYDGHITEPDPASRAALCETAFAPVKTLQGELSGIGLPLPRIVAGGTPTFPIHAKNPQVECSPGTCVLWDFGYSAKFADLDFLHAALVLTRVVSKPGDGHLCLDLGHKAIASENPHPRVEFVNLPGATAMTHSEEHLVIQTPQANAFSIGDCLYGIPRHVCPTVALYSEAMAATDGAATERWKVTARQRRLTV